MDLRISWKKTKSTTNWIPAFFEGRFFCFSPNLSRSRVPTDLVESILNFPKFFNGQKWNGSIPISSIHHLTGKSQLKNSEFNLKIGSFANKVLLGVLTKDIQKPGEKVTTGDAKKLSLALALLADGWSSSADSGGAAGSVHRSLGDHRSLWPKKNLRNSSTGSTGYDSWILMIFDDKCVQF